jgi:hypothetical protein
MLPGIEVQHNVVGLVQRVCPGVQRIEFDAAQVGQVDKSCLVLAEYRADLLVGELG